MFDFENIVFENFSEILLIFFLTLQISNLQHERDFLIKKQDEVNDSQRVRTLQRDNTQVRLTVYIYTIYIYIYIYNLS